MENIVNVPQTNFSSIPQSATNETLVVSSPPQPSLPGNQRKKKIFLVSVIIFVLLIIGGIGWFGWRYYLSSREPSSQPSPFYSETSQHQKMSEIPLAHNSFGFDIFHELIAQEEKSKNIFVSPASIALALSMTYNGADGETKEAMERTMHILGLSVEDLNQASKKLVDSLESADPMIELAIANSIWARKGISFKPEFLETNRQYYDAKIESIDFSQTIAADTINAWVSENTRGKIPTIVSLPIDPAAVMYLINAIYFKGSWTYEFDEKLTQERPFTLYDNSTQKYPLMKQTRRDFLYLENEDFQAVKLPYGKNKKLSMSVFLPKASLVQLLGSINQDNWEKWNREFKEMEGTLLLPKFKIEYEKELQEILINLGMGSAFATPEAFGGSANFNKMRDEKDIFISKVIHKTFIEVNEKGTEAAAATAVVMELGAMPQQEKPKTFYMEVNKPFFFVISDNETNEILFMGLLKNRRYRVSP